MDLLTTFNFRVTLRRSAQLAEGLAGSSRSPAQPPSTGKTPGEALADGGFQECSGLDLEMDVQELLEGGRNDGVIKRVGRGKYQNLVLKRGMFVKGAGADGALWLWLRSILTGERPVTRYDGTIELLNRVGMSDQSKMQVLAKWTFERGLPAKVTGPQLNAKTGEIAIEELHIAHEGLRWGA